MVPSDPYNRSHLMEKCLAVVLVFLFLLGGLLFHFPFRISALMIGGLVLEISA